MYNIYSNPTPLRQKFIEYLTLNRKAERTVHTAQGSPKARLARADPLPEENACIVRTQPNPFGQLGNTGVWTLSIPQYGPNRHAR